MNICYDGIGCNEREIHTELEFLEIMNHEFTHKSWKDELAMSLDKKHYQLDFKDWVLPDDFVFFTLSDWLEYSGAIIQTVR